MEPLVVLEHDPIGGQVEIRSEAPTHRSGRRTYYEVRLHRPGDLAALPGRLRRGDPPTPAGAVPVDPRGPRTPGRRPRRQRRLTIEADHLPPGAGARRAGGRPPGRSDPMHRAFRPATAQAGTERSPTRMHAVVIGGSGQIGGWLLRVLERRGHTAVGTYATTPFPGLVHLDDATRGRRPTGSDASGPTSSSIPPASPGSTAASATRPGPGRRTSTSR